MAGWLRSILDWLAPRVCPDCEGGSGAVRDAATGAIRICPACHGSGRPRAER